jgi:hypothetical protein
VVSFHTLLYDLFMISSFWISGSRFCAARGVLMETYTHQSVAEGLKSGPSQ